MESKKQQLVLTKGLPGSGKSTWAKAWVQEDPKNRVRVNRDDIRHMLGPYWVPTREKLVDGIEESTILMALMKGYSVVVDATNFKFDIARYTSNTARMIPRLPLEVEWKDFTDVPLETCIERDSKRGIGMVGEKVIRGFYEKYLKQ